MESATTVTPISISAPLSPDRIRRDSDCRCVPCPEVVKWMDLLYFIPVCTTLVIDFLFSEGLLYILIGKPAQYTNHTIYIDNDNLLAGQEATEYLYALGHRKIAYLGVDNSRLFRRPKNRLYGSSSEPRTDGTA